VQPLAGCEESITVHGPREFTGDVNLILGSRPVTAARVRDDGEALALAREALLTFLLTDPELSDLFMRTFLQRRAFLIAHGKGDAALVCVRHSPDTLRLREFLSRNGRPYTYPDVESDTGVRHLIERFGVGPTDLPALIPGVERFQGTGVYHAATHLEAQLCGGEEVAVVGGGNSAGQAVVYLARNVRHVHMLVRGARAAALTSSRCAGETTRPAPRRRARSGTFS
jgi:thioredoxin reductase (NADPH)